MFRANRARCKFGSVTDANNMPHRTLREMIDHLSSHEVSVVERFVSAMLKPVSSEPIAPTWLATPEWRASFAAYLQGYHALSAEPLGRLQFEAAFNQACQANGWRVEPARAATQRFYDTTIHDDEGRIERRLSLKASSAAGMTPDKIHISKLTEAAWIQDVRRQADRRSSIRELFKEYQETTSSIFILRGFAERGEFDILYELAEIPTSIFAGVTDLTVQQAQANTINVPPGSGTRDRDFAIRIDRSDAKMTISGIRLDLCTIHGRWGLT
jgi:hypothetical protein